MSFLLRFRPYGAMQAHMHNKGILLYVLCAIFRPIAHIIIYFLELLTQLFSQYIRRLWMTSMPPAGLLEANRFLASMLSQ